MTRYVKCDNGVSDPYVAILDANYRTCETCVEIGRDEYERIVRAQFNAEHNELVAEMREKLDTP